MNQQFVHQSMQTRRSFLKAAAVAGSVAAPGDLAVQEACSQQALANSEEQGMTYTRSTCSPNCTGVCGMIAAGVPVREVAGTPRRSGAVRHRRGMGRRRYFSEDKIAELYADKTAPEPLGNEAESKLRVIAKRAIEADLRLADEMEAA